MKTGRTQMSIGSMLLALELIGILTNLRRPGGLAALVPAGSAAIGFWIGFCLPAVLGIRKRKEVYAAMRDPNHPDPWDR